MKRNKANGTEVKLEVVSEDDGMIACKTECIADVARKTRKELSSELGAVKIGNLK